jgi:hypothetical protein
MLITSAAQPASSSWKADGSKDRAEQDRGRRSWAERSLIQAPRQKDLAVLDTGNPGLAKQTVVNHVTGIIHRGSHDHH